MTVRCTSNHSGLRGAAVRARPLEAVGDLMAVLSAHRRLHWERRAARSAVDLRRACAEAGRSELMNDHTLVLVAMPDVHVLAGLHAGPVLLVGRRGGRRRPSRAIRRTRSEGARRSRTARCARYRFCSASSSSSWSCVPRDQLRTVAPPDQLHVRCSLISSKAAVRSRGSTRRRPGQPMCSRRRRGA